MPLEYPGIAGSVYHYIKITMITLEQHVVTGQ